MKATRYLVRTLGSLNVRQQLCFAAVAIFWLFATSSAPAAVRAEAYRGEPFGMGRVTVDLPADYAASPASDDRFGVVEVRGRAIYPVTENRANRPVRRILRSFLNVDVSSRATFYFMFHGDEPLELTVFAPEPQRLTIRPDDDAEEFNELLDDWWEATKDRYQEVFEQAEYPVVVENYLTATWARRLDREMPQPSRYLLRQFRSGDEWVSKLAANESYRTEVERDLLLGRFAADDATTIALPESRSDETGAPASDGELPAPPPEIGDGIEPIAAHVPRECFYMRFGNFPNYLWFRDFLRHWQGDLGNMLVMESVDRDNSERFQQQIAVGESKLARVMGPTVIRDVAIIGHDFYLRDGAAMGILFQANSSSLLQSNLGRQRTATMADHKGAKEESITIAGHEVSYISSPDGHLRSYYAIDGDFHLVANCRKLIERFLEAGDGDRSLAQSPEFQDARQHRPLAADDTIFIYLSAAFLENLAGPHYRVELDRRLRSIGEMRALTLARLAAEVEGRDADSLDDLIEAELLPPGFAERADGSELEVTTDGYRDSLRGTVGHMVPIPDMPVEMITSSESRRLADFQRGLQESVGRFAPISLALKRKAAADASSWDHITADIRISPYSQMPIGRWPNMLGPAATTHVAPIEGDVASIEMVVDALGEPVHLFGGLRDFQTPLVVRQGEVQPDAATAEYLRAYVGGWPRPHLIDRFLGRPEGPFDDEGIARTRGLFDLWLRRADDFFLFSFKRDVLTEVGPRLAMVDDATPAQIRLHVDDLSDKQVADAVSALGYMRARDTSASAARFMNSLTAQLQVPAEDARPLAEQLVDGRFDCPLGGDYVLVDPSGREATADGRDAPADELPLPRADGRLLWTTTATPPENRFLLTVIPADYTMPFMNWFRGVEAEVARVDDQLTVHAELDMVHLEVGPPEEPGSQGEGFQLPSLGELFSGFGKTKDEGVQPASANDEE